MSEHPPLPTDLREPDGVQSSPRPWRPARYRVVGELPWAVYDANDHRVCQAATKPAALLIIAAVNTYSEQWGQPEGDDHV